MDNLQTDSELVNTLIEFIILLSRKYVYIYSNNYNEIDSVQL